MYCNVLGKGLPTVFMQGVEQLWGGVLSIFFISVISSSTVGFFLFLNHAVIVAHDHKCAS